MQAEESESKPFAAQQLASPRRRKAQNAPVLILPSAPRKGAREECLSACKFIAVRNLMHCTVSNTSVIRDLGCAHMLTALEQHAVQQGRHAEA